MIVKKYDFAMTSNKNEKLSRCVVQPWNSIFMISDKQISFKGDLSFDMVVILNF